MTDALLILATFLGCAIVIVLGLLALLSKGSSDMQKEGWE